MRKHIENSYSAYATTFNITNVVALHLEPTKTNFQQLRISIHLAKASSFATSWNYRFIGFMISPGKALQIYDKKRPQETSLNPNIPSEKKNAKQKNGPLEPGFLQEEAGKLRVVKVLK